MGKIAVLYKSRYGSTQAYADWIAAALQADLFTEVRPDKLRDYSTLIFGGGIYAGGVSGTRYLRDHFAALQEKNLVLFTVGLSDPADRSICKSVIDRAFPPEMQSRIHFFHLRGNMDYPQLSLLHRSMMRMLRLQLRHKKHRSAKDEMLLEGGRVNFLDKESITPLLDYVRSLEGDPL